ncbi:MAG TPA: hypothetical protein VHW68_03985 [Actinomycetota bacterium]|jgi:hypothetical protein|nr:hypothetical protein [Actinomycetota bacterium]
MRDEQPEQPDDERGSDDNEPDEGTKSAPTRAGSNVPNAGRDPDEGRNE